MTFGRTDWSLPVWNILDSKNFANSVRFDGQFCTMPFLLNKLPIYPFADLQFTDYRLKFGFRDLEICN